MYMSLYYFGYITYTQNNKPEFDFGFQILGFQGEIVAETIREKGKLKCLLFAVDS